jgi:hypothetical protein
MKTIVFYFSGTGNSFALAKEIAENICIVFPSYLAPVAGLPMIVDRFVRKIDNIADITIFAICNCGGYESVNALPSLNRLQQIVKSCGENYMQSIH